jgi:hypothetical protein
MLTEISAKYVNHCVDKMSETLIVKVGGIFRKHFALKI